MLQDAWEIGSEQGVGHEYADDQRQNPPQCPPRDIQYKHNQDAAKQQIIPIGVTHAEGLFFDAQKRHTVPGKTQIKRRGGTKHHQDHIEIGHTAQPERSGFQIKSGLGLDQRKKRVSQDEETREMPAHVPVIGRQAEPGGQVVIDRICQGHVAKKSRETRADAARCGTFIIFLFDLSQFFR